MRTLRTFLFMFAAMAFAALFQASTSAQGVDAYCSGGFPNPGWFGYNSSPYASGRIPTPPYFALHPPVYYSYPVPRTYGYSPYAYPGSVRTPEVEVKPKVAIIDNPYVTPKKTNTRQLKTANYVPPKEILNPFAKANQTNSAFVATE